MKEDTDTQDRLQWPSIPFWSNKNLGVPSIQMMQEDPPSLGESPSPRRTPMSERSTLRANDGWASRSGLTVAWNPSIGQYSSGGYQFNDEESSCGGNTKIYNATTCEARNDPKVIGWVVDVPKADRPRMTNQRLGQEI